ncbi:uncharacterized protein LOC130665937 [Microplitis mediator]|uniref:uncharacterized protein LOC130665937 n=1 Tax=Microplitis mediator TaxID=375433 RepID=UPI0025577402|nr:uncharacterized protein LOC130665937 [Microplitis mediator]
MGNMITSCYIPDEWISSHSHFLIFEEVDREVGMCLLNDDTAIKCEWLWDHIFTIDGEMPTRLTWTDDHWWFKLTHDSADEPSAENYTLVEERAVDFFKNQAMLGSPTVAPPPSLVNTLMESTGWFNVDDDQSMDTAIDDVLNDQLDIDELLGVAEQQQQQQQQQDREQQCRRRPAAPLIHGGKPLWYTRKPPSPEISDSDSTSTYDVEVELMRGLDHIREQQSMEIERLQQVQQQQQLQMEQWQLQMGQQQLQIQQQQSDLQRHQEREQWLEGEVKRLRALQDLDASVFVEQSQEIDYWQLQYHQLQRNCQVLLNQLNMEAADFNGLNMDGEF